MQQATNFEKSKSIYRHLTFNTKYRYVALFWITVSSLKTDYHIQVSQSKETRKSSVSKNACMRKLIAL